MLDREHRSRREVPLLVLLALLGASCAGVVLEEDDPGEEMLVADTIGPATVPGGDNSLLEDDPTADPATLEAAELAEAEVDLAAVPEPTDDVTVAAAPAPACTKHVTLTLISYTGMGKPVTNGCWGYERPRQEPDAFRICHFDKDITQGTTKWFYDDVNPFYHSYSELLARIHECGFATSGKGYELLASHNGAWRLVRTALASLYYAEVYTDNNHVQDAWSAYRYSTALRNARRTYHVSPMINVGTDDSMSAIRTQLYKMCRRIKSGRHLGVYAESGHPIGVVNGAHHSVARMHMIEQALNACTTR